MSFICFFGGVVSENLSRIDLKYLIFSVKDGNFDSLLTKWIDLGYIISPMDKKGLKHITNKGTDSNGSSTIMKSLTQIVFKCLQPSKLLNL